MLNKKSFIARTLPKTLLASGANKGLVLEIQLTEKLANIYNTVKPFITTHIYFHVTAVWIWSRPYNYAHQLYYR